MIVVEIGDAREIPAEGGGGGTAVERGIGVDGAVLGSDFPAIGRTGIPADAQIVFDAARIFTRRVTGRGA